ncbi:MAG TPA: invasin domain 3-containing protein, partial [Longimicrobium sp.]|nr:invasin domain 3-containing protein [Longimicrobium sp.]
ARLVSDYLVGRKVAPGIDVATRGDVNGDGRVTSVDVAIITAAAAGRDVSRFPVGRPVPDAAFAVQCRGDVRAGTIACGSPGAPDGVRGDVLVGGQHVFVELATSIVSNSGGVLAFNTTVKNLLPQAMGLDSATGAVNANGVRVFFHDGPNVTGGTGVMTVADEDGVETFTGSNQSFYRYSAGDLGVDSILAPGETSAPKLWKLQYDPGVTTFSFTLFLSTAVQFPAGWVDVYPPYHAPSPTFVGVDTLLVGQTLQLVDSVRNRNGVHVGAPVSWSSTGHGAASVNGTGLVTADSVGVDSIIATSGVRTGRVSIVVTAPNVDSTTVTADPTSIAAGGTSTITVQVRDGFGRIDSVSVLDVEITTDRDTLVAGADTGQTVNATSIGGGKYVATLHGRTVGTATLTATINAAPVTDNATVTITAAGAASIEKTAGDGQTATVNTAVATAPKVTVKDQFGNPVSGAPVTFTVGATSGTVSDGTTTGSAVTINTNASGEAAVASWTLGTGAGLDSLYASTPGATTVAFTATATAGAAANIVKSAGDGQTAVAGTTVPVNPVVTVTDAFSNPVPGVSVTFTAAGNGEVSDGTTTGTSVTITTDGTGVAAVSSWKLRTTAGLDSLTATAGALSTVFTATATAGAPANIAKSAGDGQTATVNTAVPTAPAVLITDANGNPVSGVSVTFTPATGDGSVTGSPATTNASGIATVGSWTLGTAAGADSLTATAGALSTVFTATGTAGPPANIIKNAGDAQTDTVGKDVAIAPQVKITDSFGNPVFGVSVAFAVATGGGAVTGTPATTDSAGLAAVGSWKLGNLVGSNSLTATAGALSTTFTATGIADAPAKVANVSADSLNGAVGAAVSPKPQVEVTDQHGNVTPGVTVTFTAIGGGGTVTGPIQTTGINGRATVGDWILGSTAPFPNRLEAKATGGTSPADSFRAFVQPVANSDNSQAMGNTTLGSTVAPNVLTNDVSLNGGTLRVTSVDSITTFRGGKVKLDSIGALTYLPPAGNVLIDSAQYIITDGFRLDSAYVRFTFIGKVWYVDNTNSGAADGRDFAPFTSVGAAATAAAVNDTILVRTGTGTTNGGTLKNGQQVQGARFGPFTAVINTQTVTLLAKGAAPTVGGLTLGSGNRLYGFRVLNGSGAGLTGTSIGTLRLDSLSVGATGGAALDLSNGTVTNSSGSGAVTLDSLRSTNSSGAGFSLSAVGGTL